MSRLFSGIQPSGPLHLGNYLGAVRRWVVRQESDEGTFCIVDLHALTLDIEPATLRALTLETALGYLASGLDPERVVLFVQSHVPEHSELAWLLECTASYGELQRMIQFKEKSAAKESVRVGLFTYPCLMAADILAHDTDKVPVGDDQRQHIELTRTIAQRFNSRYGETFTVPDGDVGAVGARIMDLQDPTRKMSKSTGTDAGTIFLSDSADQIAKKIRRAVTDTDTEVRYDPEHKPGVANLLEILGASIDARPEDLAAAYDSYGALKKDTAEAVEALLTPVRRRMEELREDRGALDEVLAHGATRARARAGAALVRAQQAIGLLEPPRAPALG